MPSFDIVKEITAGQSFKIEQVKSGFDLQTDHIREQFTGNIDIEGKDWNVGLIVGRSGTGKTSIAKEVFKESYPAPHEYGQGAIIDEMPAGKSYKEISQTFTSVGFSSPPSWLKPYHVLSNGERMRVDLAYAILSDADPILFDEFTSVVDRDIAKICSFAISKSVRKLKKKFIAVSCHDDIIDWLEPDWVYNTNSQTFTFRGYQKTRPEIKIDIYRTEGDKNALWKIFGKYHYLNPTFNNSAAQYVGYYQGKPVCHCGIIQMPLKTGMKRIHRLVVLPDYQGVGIGSRFISLLSSIYQKLGESVFLITSSPALLHSLQRRKDWVLLRAGRSSATAIKWIASQRAGVAASSSHKRVTYSFRYTGGV